MATILIVDDEAVCRLPLTSLLQYEGYQVLLAVNGLEGLQKLSDHSVDLILLDLCMPGVDGLTMLQAVRKNDAWQDIPVLLVTADHDPRIMEKARTVGFEEYLFKGDVPFSRMLELIKRHLGEHHVPKRRGRKPKIRPAVEQQGNVLERKKTVMPSLEARCKALNLGFLYEEEEV